MDIRNSLANLGQQFDMRSATEKMLVAVLALAGLVWLYVAFSLMPLSAQKTQLERQITQTQTQLRALELREQQAISDGANDPNEPVRLRIERARRQQENLDNSLLTQAGNLVSPQGMTRVLMAILERQDGLTLVQVQNLPSQMVQQSAADAAGNAGGTNIYRHSLNLELEGDYLSLLAYLRRIESLPERFFWDQLSFVQTQWPRARIVLELHTLSTAEGFVGV